MKFRFGKNEKIQEIEYADGATTSVYLMPLTDYTLKNR